jgi:RNA polymerase sigma factor (sigma-70 family)
VYELLKDPGFQEAIIRAVRRVRLRAPYLTEEEDFVQDVVVRALSHARQFTGQTREECIAWFRKIAQNALIDLYRRSTVRPRETTLNREVAAEEEDPRLKTLPLVLAGFSATECWLLKARVVGLPYRYISQLLGKEEVAVRKKYSRLLEDVAKQMRELET